MLTRKEMDVLTRDAAEKLGVGSPEFLKRHREIMEDIEKAREGLHASKRHAKAI